MSATEAYNFMVTDGRRDARERALKDGAQELIVRFESPDKNGVKLGDWITGQMPAGAEDAIQFNMKLGKKLVGANVDIPLDFNLPGFSLDINGGFGFDLQWAFDFGFGLSVSTGFYLTTNRDNKPEIRVEAVAYLSGQNGQPFTAEGKLLFFTATVVDMGRHAAGQAFKASGADVLLGVDVRGDSKGRLGLAQLFSQSPSQTFGTVFSVNTDIKLQTTLAVAGNIKAMPKLRANLIIDWDWQYGQKLNAPKVDLTNLAIDVGSLVNDFLLPIADRLSGMVSPFKPFVDMMLTPIGGMAFTKMIGIENTPLGLLNGLLRFKGKPQHLGESVLWWVPRQKLSGSNWDSWRAFRKVLAECLKLAK